MERRGQLDPLAEIPTSVDEGRLTGHVLIVGYGRVGRRIGEALMHRGVPIIVAEQNRETVERLRAAGVLAVSGDASEPAVLIQAHVARAGILVIAVPDTFRARKMIETARTLRPDLDIVVRAHSDDEAELLRKERAGVVFMGEHEPAVGMTRHVLSRIGAGAGDSRVEQDQTI
jgi:CPA2 family monovalent cation:H+ antiporter-2